MNFAPFLAKNFHLYSIVELLHFSLPKICTLASPLLNGAEFTHSVAKNVALFETVRVLRFASVKWRDRGSKHRNKRSNFRLHRPSSHRKMNQINNKNYWKWKKRLCVRLRSEDKHHLRKSADRKAQISHGPVSGTNAFLILCFSICRFSEVVFILRAQPYAQSLFLFPIVFGINMFQLPAFEFLLLLPALQERPWIVMSTWSSTIRRVGDSKFSSLYRDTRYLAKDCNSELQACFGVDVRSDVVSIPPPFTCCVVCQRLLAKHQGQMWLVCGVEVLAILSGGSLTLKPAASAFPSIVKEGQLDDEEKKKKKTDTTSCCLPAPRPFRSWSCRSEVTLRRQSPLSDCRRSRFVDRNSNRAGMPSLGVSRAVMMPKL